MSCLFRPSDLLFVSYSVTLDWVERAGEEVKRGGDRGRTREEVERGGDGGKTR